MPLIFAAGLAIWSGPLAADQTDPALGPLFADLQSTVDTEKATGIADIIWQIWHHTDDPKAGPSFKRGLEYMNSGELKAARDSFTDAIKADPEFAEAWNKRATVAFYLGDLEASVRDIESTLALEPRHFGALSGLSMINEAYGREETALDILNKVKEIFPALPGLDMRMEMLSETIRKKGT